MKKVITAVCLNPKEAHYVVTETIGSKCVSDVIVPFHNDNYTLEFEIYVQIWKILLKCDMLSLNNSLPGVSFKLSNVSL